MKEEHTRVLNLEELTSTFFSLTGSDFQTIKVQHGISYKNSCGACQPIRAPKDVGWSEEGQQKLSITHHKGKSSTAK